MRRFQILALHPREVPRTAHHFDTLSWVTTEAIADCPARKRIEGWPAWREHHLAPPNLAPQYIITFDGGSKGNPGAGYGSYELRTRDNRSRVERKDYPGQITNNEAEYRTLIAGLEDLLATLQRAGKDPKSYHIEVRGDSQLVIQQLRGKYKVRHPNMLPLYEEARALAARLGGVDWIWHERKNSVAVLGH